MFKVDKTDTRTHFWTKKDNKDAFIVDFEHISYLFYFFYC